ncbi:MAG: SGNH/GDSL hydrolase family protein [Phycisphaerales bacterium]|jgi:hypothetical protein|nr:SGNH/GDSL hydrolase family protein [Phycisphaerales bacterium]
MMKFMFAFIVVLAQISITAGQTVSGLVIPLDDHSMYVRDSVGKQIEVKWTAKTRVAIRLNYRKVETVLNNTIRYNIDASREKMVIALPKAQAMARRTFRRDKELGDAKSEKWMSSHGLQIYYGKPPAGEEKTSLSGKFTFAQGRSKPASMLADGRKYEISMKKGGQTQVLIYDVWTTKNCKPFVNQAAVIGSYKGETLIADEIHLTPIGDQTSLDDPKLPRYLFIGDSISGNYDKGLRAALKGKFNLHHPPTNCGPSSSGRKNILSWLGAYKQKGRHWDVISFNHGHWDAGRTCKTDYQANLEYIIAQLKKTNAKLIWVTTCPVPRGYPQAGPAVIKDNKGKKETWAPGRTSGVMEKYINPWALEVMKKHPEITICDQWRFVKDHAGDIYKEWWKSKNVHFRGENAAALGELLARHVEKVMKQTTKLP